MFNPTVYRSLDDLERMVNTWLTKGGNKENNEDKVANKDNNHAVNKDNNPPVNKNANNTMHNEARGKDIALLKLLNVGTIVDFMVEMKKTKCWLKYVFEIALRFFSYCGGFKELVLSGFILG